MEEIKVGEYVRTELGDIKKIAEGFEFIIERHNKSDNKIVKHSSNIKDLIKVGDYINGSKLLSIDYAEDRYGNCDKLHFYYSFEDSDKDVNEYYEELVIKTIVTKEQFSSVEYRLEV